MLMAIELLIDTPHNNYYDVVNYGNDLWYYVEQNDFSSAVSLLRSCDHCKQLIK